MRYLQHYEEYTDYSDYPEGEKRHRLVSARRLKEGDQPPDDAQVSVQSGDTYYRLYSPGRSAVDGAQERST